MKPELEFLQTREINTTLFMPDDDKVKSTKRTLSIDPDTKDETCILFHPPNDEWGWKDGNTEGYCGGTHIFWEEVYILKGKLWDGNSAKWYEAGSYCCRPPGMFHGPFRADPVDGCEELVFTRHERPTTFPSDPEGQSNESVAK